MDDFTVNFRFSSYRGSYVPLPISENVYISHTHKKKQNSLHNLMESRKQILLLDEWDSMRQYSPNNILRESEMLCNIRYGNDYYRLKIRITWY